MKSVCPSFNASVKVNGVTFSIGNLFTIDKLPLVMSVGIGSVLSGELTLEELNRRKTRGNRRNGGLSSLTDDAELED